MRSALGARRGALIRQFSLESLILSLAGGLLGLALASWAIRGAVLLYPDAIPRAAGVGLDWRVVAFTLALTLLTGLLISLIPAWHAARPNLSQALKEAGASTTGSAGKMRGQRALVVVQIALSIALLAGAGLMLRSFFNLRQEAVGFSVDHVLTAQLALPRLRYGEAQLVDRFFRDLTRRLAAEPGVVAVGATSNLPFAGTSFTSTVSAEGRAAIAGHPQPEPSSRSSTPGYFKALGIPLLAGRFFTEGDAAQAPLVAVVDRRLADSLWPNQDPLGRRLRLGPPDVPPELLAEHPWRTVVGVVGNVRDGGPAVPPSSEGTVYFPLAQQVERNIYLAIRTETGRSHGSRQHPAARGARDRSRPAGRRRPDHGAEARQGAGAAAPLHHPARQLRRPRPGARLARGLLGDRADRGAAPAGDRHPHGPGCRPRLHPRPDVEARAGGGRRRHRRRPRPVLALARLIGRLLYGVGTSDPMTFAGVALLLSAVALLAVFWPARRASRLHPMTAFRQE